MKKLLEQTKKLKKEQEGGKEEDNGTKVEMVMKSKPKT